MNATPDRQHLPPPDVEPGMGNCTVCGKKCQDGFLMCSTHWKMVPHAIQTKVGRMLREFRNGGATLAALRRVQAEATSHVYGRLMPPLV